VPRHDSGVLSPVVVPPKSCLVPVSLDARMGTVKAASGRASMPWLALFDKSPAWGWSVCSTQRVSGSPLLPAAAGSVIGSRTDMCHS
jgi:hypothetical protein